MSATSNSWVSTRSRRGGFSLVELLVSILVIAIVLSIVMPVVSRLRRSAEGVEC